MNASNIKIFLKTFFFTFFALCLMFFLTSKISPGFGGNQPSKKVSDPVKVPKISSQNFLLMIKQEKQDIPEYFLLFQVDPTTQNITLTALPKTTSVFLNSTTDTLAQSYAYAGCMEVVSGLERSYGLSIHYYMSASFDELATFLDFFGLLQYSVFENILIEDEFKRTIFKLDSGEQRLTGKMVCDLLKYSSISPEEKIILATDLAKAFFLQVYPKTDVFIPNTKLLSLLDSIETNLSSSSLEGVIQTLTSLEADQLKMTTATMGGESFQNILYLDSLSLEFLTAFQPKVIESVPQ